ncbi:Septum formation inhibitor-activating ATPase [Paenibacillus larvae subsp. larvae]|uniref:Septum formation inhibitor-activating ATPase n=3 Tax=Paenibacillus larvae TaxID=1464 RepID=A0A2L1TZF6_9BACL|nr:hypothetical protein [Paenibacillus larvae]AQT86449.1 hypothetical protein B1222_21910 [Paenibacillus larvae subsp. pulvifaciens]AQZ48104.1 hypothetical protein B5S25_17490 [Paenibacillus larvae subsp. pulvifaciens]AVF26052.1 Septum formation inhibitor-activating ATPase [Paenibacillus larvae subsp. larvae]AVF30830.1 Septum formation inhibitor-activating ATPase [Paenibacillus larvae subsp. larvae]MBH0342465.1 hypothetical protein [Paenibacillus larvae]
MLRLLVLDEDVVFAERLTSFIRTSEFASAVALRCCTSRTYWQENKEQYQETDVVLYTSAFKGEWMPQSAVQLVLIENNDVEQGSDEVLKFQPLRKLLQIVGVLASKQDQRGLSLYRGSTEIISVYSAIGNCGKTAIALNLALELAKKEKRVFYLSLESVSTALLQFQGTGSQQFSKWLYYVRQSAEIAAVRLEQLKSHDGFLGIDYLYPMDHLREAQEMERGEAGLLIDTLISSGAYDHIIIDLDSSFHPRIEAALERSGLIWWVITNDRICYCKTSIVLSDFTYKDQVKFVMNKFTGFQPDIYEQEQFLIAGYLPYIPEWKHIQSLEQLLSLRIFSDQVMTIYHKIQTEDKGANTWKQPC